MGSFSNLLPQTGLDSTISVAVIEDQKASGTNGGTFTSGAWYTRDLNTITSDLDSIVSLSANQFTLQAGTYVIEASAPAYTVNKHKIKLRNITDSTDELIGSSERVDEYSSGNNRSFIDDVITITSAKTFEIKHQCAVTKSDNGLGVNSNFGVNEIYAKIKITKIG